VNRSLDVNPRPRHAIQYIRCDPSHDLANLNIGVLVLSDFEFVHALHVSLLLYFAESYLIEVKVSGLVERGSSEYFVVIHYSTLVNNCDSKSGSGI
jgi:hypothetical protein